MRWWPPAQSLVFYLFDLYLWINASICAFCKQRAHTQFNENHPVEWPSVFTICVSMPPSHTAIPAFERILIARMTIHQCANSFKHPQGCIQYAWTLFFRRPPTQRHQSIRIGSHSQQSNTRTTQIYSEKAVHSRDGWLNYGNYWV